MLGPIVLTKPFALLWVELRVTAFSRAAGAIPALCLSALLLPAALGVGLFPRAALATGD